MNKHSEAIAVSVLCASFNQEKYIRKMLDGLVMQKTTFPVEFLIHDDASTDHTAEIIREYAEKYPDRIVPFYETENQYSKGRNFLFDQMIPQARGKYLAICEGDDYWTDPEKLQRQYEIMEAHPECSVCVHDVNGITEDEKKVIRTFPMHPQETGIMDTKHFLHRLLVDREWVFHTTSYFLRADMVKKAIEEKYAFFMNALYIDHGLMLLSAYAGKVYYLHRSMSVYRMQANGGVTNTNISREQDVARRKARSERGILSLEAFDQATKYAYHDEVQLYLGYMHFQIAECDGDYRFLMSREMKRYFRKLPKQVKMRVAIARFIPGFDKLYFWVRKKIKGA